MALCLLRRSEQRSSRALVVMDDPKRESDTKAADRQQRRPIDSWYNLALNQGAPSLPTSEPGS